MDLYTSSLQCIVFFPVCICSRSSNGWEYLNKINKNIKKKMKPWSTLESLVNQLVLGHNQSIHIFMHTSRNSAMLSCLSIFPVFNVLILIQFIALLLVFFIPFFIFLLSFQFRQGASSFPPKKSRLWAVGIVDLIQMVFTWILVAASSTSSDSQSIPSITGKNNVKEHILYGKPVFAKMDEKRN